MATRRNRTSRNSRNSRKSRNYRRGGLFGIKAFKTWGDNERNCVKRSQELMVLLAIKH